MKNSLLFLFSIFLVLLGFILCEIVFRKLVSHGLIKQVAIIDPYINDSIVHLFPDGGIPKYTVTNNSRINPYPYDTDGLMGTMLKPNITANHISDRDNLNNMIYTNNFGIRTDVNRKYNDLSSCQLVFTGDSFTFGYGVNFEDTFSFNTSLILEKSFASLGNPGFGSIQELIFIKSFFQNFKCDIEKIVLAYMINDFENDILFIQNNPDRFQKILDKYEITHSLKKMFMSNNRLSGWENSTMKWWRFIFDRRVDVHEMSETPYWGGFLNDYIHKSRLLTYLYLNSLNAPAMFDNQTFSNIYKEKDNEEYEYFRQIHYLFLENLISFIQDKGIELNVVIVPARYEVNDYWFNHSMSLYNLGSDKYSVDGAYNKIIDFFQNKSVNIIDGREAFKNFEPPESESFYFTYDGHFNKKGHLIFSTWLADNLP